MAIMASLAARERPETKEPRGPLDWLDHQELMGARANVEAQEPQENQETRDQEAQLDPVDRLDVMATMV